MPLGFPRGLAGYTSVPEGCVRNRVTKETSPAVAPPLDTLSLSLSLFLSLSLSLSGVVCSKTQLLIGPASALCFQGNMVLITFSSLESRVLGSEEP